MKNYFIFLLYNILLIGCIQNNYSLEYKIIEKQTFSSTLTIQKNNTIIRNCEFKNIEDHGLIIKNCNNVTVENCIFDTIQGFGILLPNNGPTNNITINNCKIQNIGVHGIHTAVSEEALVDHPNLKITNCLITKTGVNNIWMGHDHGIYVQSSSFSIQNNTISYSYSGHGISVRSNGSIINNIIYNNYGSCIDYFNDHESKNDKTLLIENNICWDDDFETDQSNKNIIDIVYDPNKPDYVLQKIIIRFNSVISFNSDTYPIEADNQYLPLYQNGNLKIYGNICVNPDSSTIFQLSELAINNYGSSSLAGFKQTKIQPYDFHLLNNSDAIDFYQGNEIVPQMDIDFDKRIIPIDAGADEYVSTK
ncbi:MAG: right-handed parallel beta-helix repeat-containing protein [Spirochaetes bacterium]|nr:right-handed parallel beta-helix repeat-containing protein [Spirochaetota bacterium]